MRARRWAAAAALGLLLGVGGGFAWRWREVRHFAWTNAEPFEFAKWGVDRDWTDSRPATARVSGVAALRAAMAAARPGAIIELAPGRYVITEPLTAAAPGRGDARIVLRAARFGDVRLEVATVQGVKVRAAYWTFENLDFRGVCADDARCEHALHITGGGDWTRVRNCRFRDFNAPVKINADAAGAPDDVRIERSNLINGRPRRTPGPVTLIDAVAADRLTVAGNWLADAAKDGGDFTSYAAFAKGGGSGARFENNLVICAWRHRGVRRVGLSLGGGGTGAGLCRRGACTFEAANGLIRGNRIMKCSDAGIYLRGAVRSTVEGNLLSETGGIQVRRGDALPVLRGNRVE